MVKYRIKIVDATGKFYWCEKYLGQGGTYNFVLILAIVIFFWGVAKMTGTEDVLLSPIAGFFNRGGGVGGGAGEW